MNKPNEYWINEFESEVHPIGQPFYGGKSGREELRHIHVIEYSAYKQLEEKLNKTIQTLEFYASGWTMGFHAGELLVSVGTDLKFEEVHQRARQTLKEIGE